MEKQVVMFLKNTRILTVLCFMFFVAVQQNVEASNHVLIDTVGYNSYKGKIIDGQTKAPLVFASLTVNGTNISTISNSKGEFLLKVPKRDRNKSVTVTFLGYTSKILNLSDFDKEESIITLETYIEELSEVEITAKDAPALIREVLKRRDQNYLGSPTTMTGFYRETIKSRNNYVSLAEAILILNKSSYTSGRSDVIKLHKSRKSTDYRKLDTIALKHRGGPHTTVHLDIIKNPEMLFTEDIFNSYDFTFDTSTKIDDRVIYVVNFKGKPYIEEVLFYGKLYIDAQSLALVNAQFKLDLSNVNKAREFFILKKPQGAKVTPVEATYYVDYKQADGKWFHSYSRVQLGFKINWKKKIFNSVYYSTIELAITDWKINADPNNIKFRDRLKTSVVMTDEASGFSDPEFWGEFNVIEPEKPIENAIKKIQKQLNKVSD